MLQPHDKVSYLTYYADVVSVEGDSVWIKYFDSQGKVTKKVDKSELIKIGNGK
jgi:hypothetical protein